jgi:hypothetical protein
MFDRIVEGPPRPRFIFNAEGMVAVAIFVSRSFPFGIAYLNYVALRWLAGKRQQEKHPLLPGLALQVSAMVAWLAIGVMVGRIQLALPDAVVVAALLFWLVRRPGLMPALSLALADLAMAGFVDWTNFKHLGTGREQILHLAMLRIAAAGMLLIGALRLARSPAPESTSVPGAPAHG